MSLKIWDTKTWSVLHALERSPPHWEPGQEGARPGYLAWSPDGRQLAAAVDKGTPGFVVFDAVTGERTLAVEGDTSGMCSIAWSPDGQRLATGSLDRTVRIWSAATGDELVTLHGHAGWPRSLGWHPSGRLLFSADERTGVMIWDASKGYER